MRPMPSDRRQEATDSLRSLDVTKQVHRNSVGALPIDSQCNRPSSDPRPSADSAHASPRAAPLSSATDHELLLCPCSFLDDGPPARRGRAGGPLRASACRFVHAKSLHTRAGTWSRRSSRHNAWYTGRNCKAAKQMRWWFRRMLPVKVVKGQRAGRGAGRSKHCCSCCSCSAAAGRSS